MQEIRSLVVTKLMSDGTLYPSLVPGGIYARRLSPEGPGQTDAAFYVIPGDVTRRVRLHPSIAIFGPNDVQPPSGPSGQDGTPVLRQGFLRLFVYVEATDAGKALFDQIAARVRWNLNGWQAQLSTGYPMTVDEADTTELIDSDEFKGSLVATLRYAVEWLRPVR